MSDKKTKKLTQTQKKYQLLAKTREPQRPLLKNCVKAFLFGGFICSVGQLFTNMYMTLFDFTERTAGDPTVATMIFIGVLLTGFGVYDRLGQWGGAGTAVPVSGFANAVASAAIEHRSEGYVLGVAAKMFKLAGSVIVFGTVSAFVIGLIHVTINYLGGL